MPPTNNQKYHHGDLRLALINAATHRLETQGIKELSLRKLAEDIGVSRSALYHHFRDKNALLNAVAARGFELWITATKARCSDNQPPIEQFRDFMHHYIQWSAQNPQLYELMFGRPLWKHGIADGHLKDIAYPAFNTMLELVGNWQNKGLLPPQVPALRQTQIIWATLHGLAKLMSDGVYADSSHVAQMCDSAIAMLLREPSQPH